MFVIVSAGVSWRIEQSSGVNMEELGVAHKHPPQKDLKRGTTIQYKMSKILKLYQIKTATPNYPGFS